MSGKISDNLGRSSGLVKAAAGGKTLGILSAKNNTRTAMSSVTGYDFWDTTYTQVKANSKIRVDVLLSGWTDSGGAESMNITYDSTEHIGIGTWTYRSAAQSMMAHYLTYFDGASSTGSKTLKISRKCYDGSTMLFQVWNPSSADDSRMSQNASTFILTEYDF